jgi:uncharacterized protein YndB with AHSA1/START domain
MGERIEKQVFLAAPVSRVWRALVDHREFGAWFQVELEGPFKPGHEVAGRVTYPGYEHLPWRALVERIEPERLFAFSWHPFALGPETDYANEPRTLVEFRLQPRDDGTLLTVTESGFEGIPAHRRAEAFRMNEQGWGQQMDNIRRYLESGRSGPAAGQRSPSAAARARS